MMTTTTFPTTYTGAAYFSRGHPHMKGILTLAFKLLVKDRAKYAALLVGITFAVFLMIEMTSLFSGRPPRPCIWCR